MDMEANDETTSRSSKTPPILKIFVAAIIGVMAVGGVYHLHEAGSVQANSNEVTNLAGVETTDIVKKFLLGFWDGSTLDYGTEEATIAPPPGKQKMPMKAVVGMMPVFRKAWPKMHAKVWGVEKNADGTYTADFQAVFGPMTNDMPALGPFPAVSRSSVPRYVKSGITFPVEKVTVKVNEAGTKVESALYTGIVTTKYPSAYTLVSPEVERIWGGDVEGFGAIYALCGA